MELKHGLHFPIVLDQGQVAEPTLLDSISSSIRNIFAYDYGTGFFRYSFGTYLFMELGRPLTHNTTYLMSEYIKQALSRFEKRIQVIEVATSVIGESFHVKIQAKVLQDQVNYVFEGEL